MLDGDGMTEVVHVKQCKCIGTASTGRCVMEIERREADGIKYKLTFYLEPVCDVCDTPWKEE